MVAVGLPEEEEVGEVSVADEEVVEDFATRDRRQKSVSGNTLGYFFPQPTKVSNLTVSNYIVEAGSVVHDCEGELVCRWTMSEKVPYFNAGMYLENKKRIGKVDEILGKVSDIIFSIKMDPGVQAKSFQPNDLIYIGTDKLLPLSRFTSPNAPKSSLGGGRGRGGRSGGRGGGGRSPGGRGFSPGGRGRVQGRGRGRGFGGGGRF